MPVFRCFQVTFTLFASSESCGVQYCVEGVAETPLPAEFTSPFKRQTGTGGFLVELLAWFFG